MASSALRQSNGQHREQKPLPLPPQPAARLLKTAQNPIQSLLTSQIISTALHKQQLGLKNGLQLLERVHVGGDVFPDGGVRASTSLDGTDSGGRECFVADEEFLVFLRRGKGVGLGSTGRGEGTYPGEDIVRDGSYIAT